MVIIAKSIGVLIGVMGLIFLVFPDQAKKVMAFWKKGNNIYWAGMIRLAIGVILLITAMTGARQAIAAAFLGILFLISGAVIFVLGVEETKKQIVFWEYQSALALRLMALFIITFGALIFCIY